MNYFKVFDVQNYDLKAKISLEVVFKLICAS